MKRSFLFCCMAIVLSQPVFSNVFRVNNTLTTDPAQKLFKTLKEAHDATTVVAGDTLLIEGTTITHPDLIMTKPLVLIGTGYLLTANPQTQYNNVQSVVSRITIKPEAAGTILVGLTFSNDYSTYAPFIQANNVIIMRCLIPNTLYLSGDVNNVQIIQNFFQGGGINIDYSTDKFTNVVLKNNVISNAVSITSTSTYQRLFSAVENNIFLGTVTLTASTFRNNIISTTLTAVNISSGFIQNNLVSNSQIPSGNGNQTYDATKLFVGATGNSADGQYKLKDNSPYLTAGYNGVQPGIFGGSMPYVLSGMPPVPSIYELNADGFGSKQSGLQVTIKAKANQ